MSKYRHKLPQLKNELFITDGGLETTLIFHEGIALNSFAAFDLLKDDTGVAQLHKYFGRYAELARAHGVSAVLESPTWRANPDWADKLGYDAIGLADANRKAIGLLLEVRDRYESTDTKIVISGNLGPRGDGYNPTHRMTVHEAKHYHLAQLETFAATDADMAAAFTMNYPEEAIGIVSAAEACTMPIAISFTLETDGRLPSGDSLFDAINRTDDATGGYPAYYMINCAHPSHFAHILSGNNTAIKRIRGLRANASKRSHAELDASSDLDAGNPSELANDYRLLRQTLPLSVVGGCCGTDHQHVDAICAAMKSLH